MRLSNRVIASIPKDPWHSLLLTPSGRVTAIAPPYARPSSSRSFSSLRLDKRPASRVSTLSSKFTPSIARPGNAFTAPARSYHAADEPPREWIPPSTNAEASEFLSNLLPPLEFPEKVVRNIITHPSWKAGVEGHNNRLSFIGRRTLNAYMALFLHAARLKGGPSKFNPSAPEMNYQHLMEPMLDSYNLGRRVGLAWKVDRVMRWIPAVATESGAPTGVNSARATTVEAIMGGVLHQYGGTVAHRVFTTRLLPPLRPLMEPEMQAYADEVCKAAGGRRSDLLTMESIPVRSPSIEQAPEPIYAEIERPLKRAAMAA